MNTSTTATRPQSGGRGLLALGLFLTIVGIVVYTSQVLRGRLAAPWYMPLLASLGLVLVIVSLWYKRTIWRILALVLALLLTGGEWAFLLGLPTPPYPGPVQAGESLPTFTTTRADGTSFTRRDLEGSQNNVLVSFRGRW